MHRTTARWLDDRAGVVGDDEEEEMKKRSTNSITIKFPKVQAKCECGCYSSVHAVAQMVGEHCIGCKACTGWKPSMPVSK
jgi:hypothetical protein